VALQEGAEANQGDDVLAVQGAGDFFENGVEDAVGLFFGEIRFFRGQRDKGTKGRQRDDKETTKGTDLFKHRLAKKMQNLNKSVPLSQLKRYQRMTGQKTHLAVEKSYLKGVEVPKGTAGSARPDVYNKNTGEVLDYKFTKDPNGSISSRQQTNNNNNLPIKPPSQTAIHP